MKRLALTLALALLAACFDSDEVVPEDTGTGSETGEAE